jgi:hypothetical protein
LVLRPDQLKRSLDAGEFVCACVAGRFGSPVRIVTPIRDATVRPIVRCAGRVARLTNEENCQSRRRIPLSRKARILSILTRM